MRTIIFLVFSSLCFLCTTCNSVNEEIAGKLFIPDSIEVYNPNMGDSLTLESIRSGEKKSIALLMCLVPHALSN